MGFIDLQWDSIDFVSLPQLASCCFCGIFCYTCTFLACRPLQCGEKSDIFCCCIENGYSCVCKKPCSGKTYCGCKQEGDCGCVEPQFLMQCRTLCCPFDTRCALPPTSAQPLLFGLFPCLKLYGSV